MSQIIVSLKTAIHGHIWRDAKIDELLLRELGQAPVGAPLKDVSLRSRQGGVYIFNAMDSHLPQTLLDHGSRHVSIIESTLPSTKKWKCPIDLFTLFLRLVKGYLL
uniref:Uncharacterized protein n=1 Tax=Plectus sambesii TaxID=2011161 RepID=A0A914XG63_9BILA